jgi:MFS superfamily sulfate permease-like transporter
MDAFACIVTFISSLFLGMEYGILVGVGISIGSLLLKSLKPELTPEVAEDNLTGIKYLYITPSNSGVNFPSVDHISSTIQKLSLKHKKCRVIVLDFQQWTSYDYTTANTLLSLVKGLKKNGKIFIFTHCNEEWVTVLKLAGLAHPPALTGGKEELSEYLKKNIQPVIALDLEGFKGGHRSNPSLNEGEGSSEASEEGSIATTTNSAKELV